MIIVTILIKIKPNINTKYELTVVITTDAGEITEAGEILIFGLNFNL